MKSLNYSVWCLRLMLPVLMVPGLLALEGCESDDPDYRELMIGSWQLSTIEESVEGDDFEDSTGIRKPCQLDNRYIFNPDSTYQETEGELRCDSAGSQIIDRGRWAVNGDGTRLILDSGTRNNTFIHQLDTIAQDRFALLLPGPEELLRITYRRE
jgi:hypothetical protein